MFHWSKLLRSCRHRRGFYGSCSDLVVIVMGFITDNLKSYSQHGSFMDDLSSCDLRKTSKKQRRKDPGASIVAQIVSKTRRVATKSSSQNSGNTKKPRQEHMLSEGVNKTGTRKHPKRYRMRTMKCIFVKSSNFREVGGRGCGLYISRMT